MANPLRSMYGEAEEGTMVSIPQGGLCPQVMWSVDKMASTD